jgi:hypothetical protein
MPFLTVRQKWSPSRRTYFSQLADLLPSRGDQRVAAGSDRGQETTDNGHWARQRFSSPPRTRRSGCSRSFPTIAPKRRGRPRPSGSKPPARCSVAKSTLERPGGAEPAGRGQAAGSRLTLMMPRRSAVRRTLQRRRSRDYSRSPAAGLSGEAEDPSGWRGRESRDAIS